MSSVGLLVRLTALDRAVVFSGLAGLVAACMGAMNAVLVASVFSPALQGVFYTFGSLATLYVFLEFGIGQTAIRFASHEWAIASTAEGRSRGRALVRLATLRQVCVVWYAVCSLLIVVVIGLAGYALFARREMENVGWIGPWSVLCVGSAINVLLAPVFLFIQVYEKSAVFWFYRLVYQLVYGVALGCSVYLGAGLWAVGVATWLGLLWSMVYARRHAGLATGSLGPALSGWTLWYRELWPLQWRMATTWLSSYIVTPLLIVVAFHYSGPVLAGQVGMSGTANILVLAVASGWVVTRGPKFAGLVAQARSEDLELLFARAWRAMLVVATGGGLGLWLTVYLLNVIQHPLADRLVGPLPMVLLAIATVMQAATVGAVTYIRAHGAEPLGLVSVVTLTVTVVGSAALVPRWGAAGIAVAHLMAVSIVQTPAALWWLGRLRREHARVWTIELSASK